MKKKLYSILATALMVTSIAPMSAFAASPASAYDFTVPAYDYWDTDGEKTDGTMTADVMVSKNSEKVTLYYQVGDASGVGLTNTKSSNTHSGNVPLTYSSSKNAKNGTKCLTILNKSAYNTKTAGKFYA